MIVLGCSSPAGLSSDKMGHWLDGSVVSGCPLSPVLSSGAEAHRCADVMHARNTGTVFFCAVFVEYSGLASNQNRELSPSTREKRAQITSEFVAIHLSSALTRFCARSVPPTECPEWTIMGYFGSSHSPSKITSDRHVRGDHTALLHYQCTKRTSVLVSTCQLSDILNPTTGLH